MMAMFEVPLFRRAPRPPQAARELVGDERVVTWSSTAEGSFLVATPSGLWGPFAAARAMELVPWWRISKAVWRDDVLTVTASDVDDLVITDRPPLPVRLVEANAMPSVVRKRVEGSIRKTERVSLPSGEVRVVARTVPGKDGLTWRARLEPGTRDTDALRAELEQLIARLTEQSDAALRF
jgi:hypothetical protein